MLPETKIERAPSLIVGCRTLFIQKKDDIDLEVSQECLVLAEHGLFVTNIDLHLDGPHFIVFLTLTKPIGPTTIRSSAQYNVGG